MTPADFVQSQLTDAEFKLKKAYEGITAQELDLRICKSAMTARELAVHLDECYACVLVEAAGGKFKWGSHEMQAHSWPEMLEELMSKRKLAGAACIAEGERGLQRAFDFMIAHDNYHVGQICLIRLEGNPDWNAFSIYNM